MLKSQDPLRKTPQTLHRIWFKIDSVDLWYNIIRELHTAFGSNWRGKPRVRRKLKDPYISYVPAMSVDKDRSLLVWFDVPDTAIAAWIAIKYGLVSWTEQS